MHGDVTKYDGSTCVSYLAIADERPFNRDYERPSMLANIPDVNGKVVLDVGCGTGFYSKHCIDNGAKVVSVDASDRAVAHTSKRCEYKNNGCEHDIAEPFYFIENNEIDVIICSLALHYVEDWNTVLKEFDRMLAPGGTVVMSTHHPVRDYTHFNAENYYSKMLVDSVLTGCEGPLKVKYFVRPLCEYIQPILSSGLQLVKVEDRQFKDFPEPLLLFFTLTKSH